MNKKSFLAFMFVAFLAFAIGDSCYAAWTAPGASEGTNDGSNGDGGGTYSYNANDYGDSSCPDGWSVCTGYGATWRYYAWDPNQTQVVIEGHGTSWAAGAVIKDGDAEICAQAGGYFRYAMVKPSTGEQHGVMSFGNNSGAFKSSLFGGGLYYRGPGVPNGGVDFAIVKAAYEEAAKTYGNLSGSTLDQNSSTSWFCASYDGPPPPGPDPEPECKGISTPLGYTESTSSQGWSSVRTQVRMDPIGEWTNDLWAKPNDVVKWRHCYYPGAQKVSEQWVTAYHNNPTELTSSTRVYPNTNTKMYQYKDANGYGWNNGYTIIKRDGTPKTNDYVTSGSEKSTVRREDNLYTVTQDWVGSSSAESSKIADPNGEYHVWAHAFTGATDSNHTWDCSWTRTITITDRNNVRDDDDNCWQPRANPTCFNQQWSSRNECNNMTGAAKCSCLGGEWSTKYISVPCTATRTTQYLTANGNGCNHGTNSVSKVDYLNNGRNDTMHAGDKREEKATVNVPYNFDMSATIKLKNACAKTDQNGEVQDSANQIQCVYAGEAAEIESGTVTVNAKYNSATNGYYSTRAPGVKIQIITFVSDTPVNSIPDNGVSYDREYPVGDMSDGETRTFNDLNITSVNVNDVPLGDAKYFCVGVQVSPGSSGGDKTLSPDGFTGYKKSGADCKPIAKKPSFQIWGGSLYSTGNITTARAVKNNLYGYNDRQYKPNGIEGANVFGSFDELSVMSLGTNRGFASGATTGDLQGGGFKTVGRFESNTDGGFCQYESPLSFASYSKAVSICGNNNNQTGMFASSAGEVDKFSYITSVTDGKMPPKKTVSSDNATISLGVGPTYGDITTETGKVILYTWGDRINIDASEIDKGKTYIVHAEGDVYIQGDIKYTESYASQEDIPKVIIYSKKNIGIICSVKRIDAVLIAEGFIDTCSGAKPSTEPNNVDMSNQLMINGTVITNKIYLKRTYGAGAGRYSSIPAEIINYDSTLVIWARSRADTGETGVLNQTYIHELAPRY